MSGFFEIRDVVVHGGRIASDVIRYRQAGTVSGWIEIKGERIAVSSADWFGFGGRSWVVREHVGLDPADLVPGSVGATGQSKAGMTFHMNWSPRSTGRMAV